MIKIYALLNWVCTVQLLFTLLSSNVCDIIYKLVITLLSKAVVFHPSPRLFVNGNYDKYDNNVTIIYETGEILTPIRDIFTTLKKIKYTEYRYNFIGGFSVKEHSIVDFSRCMYASIHKKESHYDTFCRKNTFSLKTKEFIENIRSYFSSFSASSSHEV